MGSTYQVDVVPLVELFDHICSEHIAHASVIITPALNVYFGVWPQQVTEQAGVRDILGPVLLINDLEVVQVWAEASVHTENLVIDNSTYRNDVEAKSKLLPYFDVISPFALIVESVHSVDRLALVVAPKHEEMLWVFYFVR